MFNFNIRRSSMFRTMKIEVRVRITLTLTSKIPEYLDEFFLTRRKMEADASLYLISQIIYYKKVGI